ncbi:MAG: hypothetical protein ABI140_21020 [Jatrophihabitantaceae bacterium]
MILPPDQAAPEPPMDLLVVGCGLRAAGLLSATPELFDYDVGIVDASAHLGVGSFPQYDIQSNSLGTDFFGWIDAAGPFGPLLTSGPVQRLRSTPDAFHLSMLAAALQEAGHAISQLLPARRLLLGETVVQLELSDAQLPTVLTRSGRRLQAGVVVLSMGIRERNSPELRRWAHKVLPARSLITPSTGRRCQELAQKPGLVCFAGASHSALSVLQRMLVQPLGPDTEIALVTRSPVRLHYANWADYYGTEHDPAEAVPDPRRDQCPESGNLHRYSGLRHRSKQLFLDAAAGRVPQVRVVVADNPDERERWFATAGLVIQSIGYESNLPAVLRDGQPLECTRPDGMVAIDQDGRLLAPDGAGQVFVMGMDPYPYEDNGLNPTNQYKRRGARILAQLGCNSLPQVDISGTVIRPGLCRSTTD